MEPNQSELDWRPFGWSIPRLILVGLVGSLCIVFLLVATTSTAGFSPYNAAWDGTDEFKQIATSNSELTLVMNVTQYTNHDPSATVAFVFAPEEQYSTTEAATVQQFVSNGGILVVADNYGPHGNALLSAVGASARFDGRILRDDRNNFRSPSTPVVTDSSSHPLVEDVGSLTLNYGTAIDANEAQPLINSSEYSYLAISENETLSGSNALQQYPVAAVEPVGEGQVIAIGDPSLFINAMIDESDNRQFATNLVEQRPQTLVDNSHTNSIPPVNQLLIALRASPLLAAAALTGLLGLLAVVTRETGAVDKPLRVKGKNAIHSLIRSDQETAATDIEAERPNADQEALKRHLRERHPDWDDERLEAVIAGVLRRRTDSMKDE
jgi:hypothetical protein